MMRKKCVAMIYLTPPDEKWVLNNDADMKRVAFAIKYNFLKVTKAEVYSFTERRNRAELKRS